MRTYAAALLSVVLCSGSAVAQGSSTGSSQLSLPASARPAALAGATVADVGSYSSWYVNPANLWTEGPTSILLTHSQWIQDVRAQHVGSQIPFAFGTFGASVSQTSVRGIEIRENPGPPLGTFTARFVVLQGGFAGKVNADLVIGASLKYLYEKLYIDEATGFGVDLGAIYQTSVKGLSVGLAVTNLGELGKFRSSPSRLPASAGAGASYALSVDEFTFLTYTAFAGGLYESRSHVQLGLEASYQRRFTLRLGYETGYETRGISAGLGVHYSLVSLDYAYLPFSLGLGDSHLFSIGFRF